MGGTGKQTGLSDKLLKALLDGFPYPIMVLDVELRPLLANRALKSFAGLETLPTEPTTCHQLLFGQAQPCDAWGHACPVRQVLARRKTARATLLRRFPSGETRLLEITAAPLTDEQGRLSGVIEIFRDLTEQKINGWQPRRNQAGRREEGVADLSWVNEILLREVEERRRVEVNLLEAREEAEQIYRVIPSAIFTVDRERRVISWNVCAEEITGYRAEEVIGRTCDAFALQPCTVHCGVFSEQVKKPIMNRECVIRAKDGRVRTVSKNADLLRDADGAIIGAIESFTDITDLKRAEMLLRTERDKLQSMLSALGQGMHILNQDFVVEYQNEVLIEAFGDRIGEKCYRVYKKRDQPCEICRMREALRTGEIQRGELLMANGRYYEQSCAPFQDVDGQSKVLVLLRDITEEKAVQAETLLAGQLAAIGELAAGVAHEINNPINGIINYAQILLDERGEGGTGEEILARIIREGERISAIVGNLLSFARQDDEECEAISVVKVVAAAVDLLQHQLLKDGIRLLVTNDPDLPPVLANARQLQQVFLNLLSNSRYALNQRYAGRHPQKRIEIDSRRALVDGRAFVRTRVTDFGSGIRADIVDHIFKPFFSTKKPGEGTGLGLSISHGLVKDFNGFLRVESEADLYTTMIVELPADSPRAAQPSRGGSA